MSPARRNKDLDFGQPGDDTKKIVNPQLYTYNVGIRNC